MLSLGNQWFWAYFQILEQIEIVTKSKQISEAIGRRACSTGCRTWRNIWRSTRWRVTDLVPELVGTNTHPPHAWRQRGRDQPWSCWKIQHKLQTHVPWVLRKRTWGKKSWGWAGKDGGRMEKGCVVVGISTKAADFGRVHDVPTWSYHSRRFCCSNWNTEFSPLQNV